MPVKNVKPKILLIVGQSGILITVMRLLTRAGCEVTAAQNGIDGIKLARDGDHHLIVLGVDLPDIKGFETCRRLRENSRLRHVPIVFIADRACEADWLQGLELNVADYIEQPFTGPAFVRRLLSHVKMTNDNPAKNPA